MENSLVFFTITIVILLWIYKRLTNNDDPDTLEAQGIPTEKPLPVIGNIWPLLSQKEGGINFFERLYKLFPNDK